MRFPKAAPNFGAFVEVSPNVFWTRMPLPWSLDHVNIYLIGVEGDSVLVDTGLNDRDCQKVWTEVICNRYWPFRPSKILVTHHHPDHSAGAGFLQNNLQIPVYMSRVEQEAQRSVLADSDSDFEEYYKAFYHPSGLSKSKALRFHEVLLTFSKRNNVSVPKNISDIPEVVTVDGHTWEVVYAKGHSPDQTLLFNPKQKVLIAGDLVLPDLVSTIGDSPWDHGRNLLAEDFSALEQLKALPGDTLVLPSHGLPFLGLHQRVDQIIQHWRDKQKSLISRLERLSTVANLLDEDGGSVLSQTIKHGEFKMLLRSLVARGYVHSFEHRGVISYQRVLSAELD